MIIIFLGIEDFIIEQKNIVIGILDFRYFEIEKFQATFHFYEDEHRKFMLTDKMAKHRKIVKNINNSLHRCYYF